MILVRISRRLIHQLNLQSAGEGKLLNLQSAGEDSLPVVQVR